MRRQVLSEQCAQYHVPGDHYPGFSGRAIQRLANPGQHESDPPDE